MDAMANEWNFDGLVGPTHNYSGLSFGNIASAKNQGVVANPKLAALQGLAKMKALADRGWKQGVLAPQERPNLAALRALGFSGDDASVLKAAARDARPVFNGVMSASSMWSANAATVSPSANTADKRVHFTAANPVRRHPKSFPLGKRAKPRRPWRGYTGLIHPLPSLHSKIPT